MLLTFSPASTVSDMADGIPQKADMLGNVPQERIRFCFPPMEHGAGSMHSKLQLLKFPNYIRVAVPTGNLVPYDWGETGVMENVSVLCKHGGDLY